MPFAETRFRVRRGRVARAVDRQQVAAVEVCRWRDVGERQQRRQQVNVTHLPRHRRTRRNAGSGEHQRHVQRRVVQQHPVFGLAVLAEALAMIACHRDHRAPTKLRRQRIEHDGDAVVGRRDLGVVGPAGETGRECGRWIVRRVRVVEVNPEEEGRCSSPQPCRGTPRHFRRAPLERRHRQVLPAGAFEAVVVRVEPARHPGRSPEHERPDDGPRVIAGVVQQRAERRHALQPEPLVVHDPVVGGIQPGQDGRMRRQRQRSVRCRICEHRPRTRKRAQRRCCGGRALGPQAVGAKGVDRDK